MTVRQQQRCFHMYSIKIWQVDLIVNLDAIKPQPYKNKKLLYNQYNKSRFLQYLHSQWSKIKHTKWCVVVSWRSQMQDTNTGRYSSQSLINESRAHLLKSSWVQEIQNNHCTNNQAIQQKIQKGNNPEIRGTIRTWRDRAWQATMSERRLKETQAIYTHRTNEQGGNQLVKDMRD